METVTISLNGVEVSGYAGTTILELARESGVYIPTLCHDPHLTPTGACRICLVEDEKSGNLLASCVAPIAPGQVINTRSERVVENRKRILKLLLASHPDTCMVCDKGNSCSLRTLAAELGIGLIEYKKIPQVDVIEEVNPFIERDLSKCILCGKCIRVDQELVVEGAIDYIDRGTQTRAATLNDGPLEKSECTFCGSCVAMCPTGALMEKNRVYTGTAAASATIICPYCGCGCAITLNVRNGQVIRALPAMDAAVNGGTLCVRGSYGQDYVNNPDRLKTPLIKEDGEFREATWEEALTFIAGGFSRIKDAHGADALGVYGSSKCTNEENYLLQRFTRGVLGTNNIDNGSRLYSAAGRAGLGASVGYAGTTGTLESLERSQVIMVVGADPEISAPIVSYAIKRAVKFKGAELCIIDPRLTALVPFSRAWLRPKTGTDVALLNGLARIIVREKKQDVEYVTRNTDNFNRWADSLEPYTPQYVENVTGVPKKELLKAAHLLAEAEEAAIVYGNGITQYTSGTAAVGAIANLAMLTGNSGRRGGIFALQRENNAHGASDMGTLPRFLPGYQSATDSANRKKFGERWKCTLPETPGLTVFEMMEQSRNGKLKGMYIMGENPVAGFPQPEGVREALSALDILVVTDLFLTETAEMATVVLPAAATAEKEGSFTNFEGRVQPSHKALLSPGDSLPDGEIILQLAGMMGSPMPFSAPQGVIEEIEEMVAFYHPVTHGDMESAGLNTPGTRRLYGGLFPSGFGRFAIAEYTPIDGANPEAYPFTLIIGSSRFHFGNGTRSSRSTRLSWNGGGVQVEINPRDADVLDMKQGDEVNVTSPAGTITADIKVTPAVPPGILFMPA
ncbi:MAG: molybdopterin-dependent oxidoreductase, partial [Dehalococcoidales bacterium]|nr:molybdopterin-dependent oxidoreductase [Dehalococcoidales bacterium]